MEKSTETFFDTLRKMDSAMDCHRGRMGLMQRWLDEQSQHLDTLSAQVDANLARLETILSQGPGRR